MPTMRPACGLARTKVALGPVSDRGRVDKSRAGGWPAAERSNSLTSRAKEGRFVRPRGRGLYPIFPAGRPKLPANAKACDAKASRNRGPGQRTRAREDVHGYNC